MGGSGVDLEAKGGLRIQGSETTTWGKEPSITPFARIRNLFLIYLMLELQYTSSADVSVSPCSALPISKIWPPNLRSCSMRNGRGWIIGLLDATKVLKMGRRMRIQSIAGEAVEESDEWKIPGWIRRVT